MLVSLDIEMMFLSAVSRFIFSSIATIRNKLPKHVESVSRTSPLVICPSKAVERNPEFRVLSLSCSVSKWISGWRQDYYGSMHVKR